jgi:hypothetical protein
MSRSYWNAFQNNIEKIMSITKKNKNKNKIPVGELPCHLQKDADT